MYLFAQITTLITMSNVPDLHEWTKGQSTGTYNNFAHKHNKPLHTQLIRIQSICQSISHLI